MRDEPGERAMAIRVFLGPTLPVDDARAVLDADYRPPVRYEDLPLALAEGIDVAVIIDAAFVQTLTATPTQILQCLRQGMTIFGAASAGALRAVECAPGGMRGVGGVYELYAAGFDAEDEVAVGFDAETLTPLSEAMVNVRYACAQAVGDGVLDAAAAAEILTVTKAIYFPHRTWAAIVHGCRGRVDADELRAFQAYVAERGPNLNWKRLDALECLRRVREFVGSAAAAAAGAAASRPDDDPVEAWTSPGTPTLDPDGRSDRWASGVAGAAERLGERAALADAPVADGAVRLERALAGSRDPRRSDPPGCRSASGGGGADGPSRRERSLSWLADDAGAGDWAAVAAGAAAHLRAYGADPAALLALEAASERRAAGASPIGARHAADACRDLVLWGSRSWRLLAAWARAETELGHLDRARTLAARSLTLAPGNPAALEAAARVALATRRAEDAADELDASLAADPLAPATASRLAALRAHLAVLDGDPARAGALYATHIRPSVLAGDRRAIGDGAGVRWRLLLLCREAPDWPELAGAAATVRGPVDDVCAVHIAMAGAGFAWGAVDGLATRLDDGRPELAALVRGLAAFADLDVPGRLRTAWPCLDDAGLAPPGDELLRGLVADTLLAARLRHGDRVAVTEALATPRADEEIERLAAWPTDAARAAV